MAAIAKKITILAGITSSAGTAFVSHEYTAQEDHSAASSAAPCNTPTQVRWSARKPVTWVRAKTKTRSKNSSRGVTRCSWESPPSVATRVEPTGECSGRLSAGGVPGCGVLSGPIEGVVGYLFPALAPDHAVVRTPLELLVVRDGLDVPVVLGVRLLDRRRHDVVLAARYEQQGRTVLVLEVHVVLLMAGREVGGSSDPHQPARCRDMVAL